MTGHATPMTLSKLSLPRTQAADNAERSTYAPDDAARAHLLWCMSALHAFKCYTVWMNMGCCELTWMLRSAVDAMLWMLWDAMASSFYVFVL